MLKALVATHPFKIHGPAAVVIAFLLSGCNYLQPYVLPDAISYECPGDSQACSDLRQTFSAAGKIKASADSIKQKLDGDATYLGATSANRIFNLATYGLLTAATARTARSASTAATRNLALGAGATYAAGNLFAPTTTESLYLASYSAMACVANRGAEVLTNYDAASRLNNVAVPDGEIADAMRCLASDKAVAKVKSDLVAAQVARSDAKLALDKIGALDGTIAFALRSASYNVLTEMNKQLQSQNPSSDAITAAAKSEAQMAAGLSQTGTASTGSTTPLLGGANLPNAVREQPQAPIEFPAACGVPDDVERLASGLQGVASRYKAVTDMVNKTLNEIGDLSTSCTAAQSPPPQALAVNQTTAVLDPGTSSTLVVTGGRPPYHAEWTGTAPDASKQLKKSDFDQTGRITVTEISTDQKASFVLKITDSAVVPSVVQVAVTVHPAK